MYLPVESNNKPNSKNTKIECVIVSINYSDILSYTLPNNKWLFNKIVVVTDTKDKDTKRLCDIYGVKCIQTDVFYSSGKKIDKGAGITEGLKHLDLDGYVVQLDADIWIHPYAMKLLRSLNLNPQCLYGCDRLMIESFNDWADFIVMPDIYKENWLINLSRFKLGARISFNHTGDNWHVLGFFQMWNPSTSGIYEYPSHNDVSQSDLVFSALWHRSRRILLPEVIVVHLEEGKSMTGSNWQGRKTQNFKPK